MPGNNKKICPQEKWDRMSSPKCVDDYGISMSLEEIMQCREAKNYIEPYLPVSIAELIKIQETSKCHTKTK